MRRTHQYNMPATGIQNIALNQQCNWKNSWVSLHRNTAEPRVPVLIHLRQEWITTRPGGVEFVGCHVYEDRIGPVMQYEVDQGNHPLTDVTGTITVHNKHGATIKLGTRVLALRADRERIDGVMTSAGLLTADTYVLALGVGAASVARTAGVRLPIYPAKGYSSTFPLKPGGLAPTISGVDERWLVGWSRLGDRLRLTSTAEFAGYDWGWTPRDFNNILRLARDLFPDAADYDRGEYRACLRPMTPDGPPILGLGRHRNLFFNCGHGHMGWTMACGTARIVADLMTGRMPDLDVEGLTVR